jgi:hypothetical protein
MARRHPKSSETTMHIRNVISQFTQSITNLPAEQRVLLADLAARMSSLSDDEVSQAIESGTSRGLSIRTDLRAGLWEEEDE